MPADTHNDVHVSFLGGLPSAEAAVDFAASHHSGQRRAGDRAEFVVHPMEVASLLARSGFPDHVVAAGVLHDVLEDTNAQRWELEDRFGQEVAELVAAVSDDPAIDGEEERKDEVRERVRQLGGHAAALYAADKVSKVRELRMLLAHGAPAEEIEPKPSRHRKSLALLDSTIPAAGSSRFFASSSKPWSRCPRRTGPPGDPSGRTGAPPRGRSSAPSRPRPAPCSSR